MSDDSRHEDVIELDEDGDEEINDERQQENPHIVAASSEHDSPSSAAVENDDEYPQLRARDHTYLPGVSHPLMPESLLLSSSNKKRRTARSSSLLPNDENYDDGLVKIPLLVLPPGVVIFPGSTLPIRLRHTRWIQYLGNKISASRKEGLTNEICIGVLTEVVPVAQPTRRQSAARSSWMRTGIDRRRSQNVVNVLQNMETLLGDNGEDSESSEEEEEQHCPQPRDILVGRIGTMVTITNTHGDSATDNDNWTSEDGIGVWRQPSDQLVVTAVGTGRFRVIQPADSEEAGRVTNNIAGSRFYADLSAAVCFYHVQKLYDDELPLPPLQSLPAGRPLSATNTPSRHDQIIHSLANVSSIPKFVLNNMWPWKLVSQIEVRMEKVGSLKGLNVLSRKTDRKKAEPTAFSFWAAANMPLHETEKLKLLEMESTLERLRYIRTKIVELEEEESYVCCKICKNQISAVSNLFTVGGAEGTTGNYVNEYGVIHQTVTLWHVEEEQDLIYTGRPEIKDSWFPGYSWTITYCRYCHDHLGWKFLLVDRTKSDHNRPQLFWGLSGASVTTSES